MCATDKQLEKTYVAITIGPIIKTMEMAPSPAALWASSYLFSFISKQLLLALPENVKFISPYADTEILNRDDGLGLLHDRIIFEKPESFTMEALRRIREDVLKTVANKFWIRLAFLKKYVLIRAVEYTAENPILECGKMLDSVELAEPIVPKEENGNPILSLFTNENNDKARNEEIKSLRVNLGIESENWQLLDDAGKVKDLPAIAKGKVSSVEWKRHAYYAVVRSDGDNMGKLIKSLSVEDGKDDKFEKFHEFSKACLNYCVEVAQKVHEYHGMTVYAGGDDLLAILPCDASSDGTKTVFHFLREANEVFQDAFKGFTNSPAKENGREKDDKSKEPSLTLTFGVTLCHRKYPLYEALADSADLLFGAKGKGYKNAVNLRLIKHSGQTNAVFVRNEVLTDNAVLANNKFFKFLKSIVDSSVKAGSDRAILSCLHTVREFGALFQLADKNNVDALFTNMFDDDAHVGNTFLHDELPDLYASYCLNGDICALSDKGYKVRYKVSPSENDKDDSLPLNCPESLHSLLRVLKFFVEKAGEQE